MKNLLNRRVLTALVCVFLLSVISCENDNIPPETAEATPPISDLEIQRKIDFIRSTGFEQEEVIYESGIFYVAGDMMISEQDVDQRMAAKEQNSEGGRTEQRQWQYLVSPAKVKNIKIAFLTVDEYEPYNCSGTTCYEHQYFVGNAWKTAFEQAASTWNQVPGSAVHFDIVDYADNDYDLRIYMIGSFGRPLPPGAVASADLPLASQVVGPKIRVSSAYNFYSANAKLNVAIHELGHTIGITHTDVVRSGGTDSQIPGTAGLGQDASSIMNANINPNHPKTILSTDDAKAAEILYPKTKEIIAIAIGSYPQDRIYFWYDDGTFSVGTMGDSEAYSSPANYTMPSGKTPEDIVGMDTHRYGNRVYTWYRDGTFSIGNPVNLDTLGSLINYSVASGKNPEDIVEVTIAWEYELDPPHNYVSSSFQVWYQDGTYGGSHGHPEDLNFTSALSGNYIVADGKGPNDVVGIGKGRYYWYHLTFYRDGTVSKSLYENDLDRPYDHSGFPPF